MKCKETKKEKLLRSIQHLQKDFLFSSAAFNFGIDFNFCHISCKGGG